MFQSLHFHNSNTQISAKRELFNLLLSASGWSTIGEEEKNSLCMPITLRVFSENQYSCGFLRIVQLWWWKHFEFEVWSHQNPVKLTRKIYLRKNCEPQEKKDEESWKSSADPNNPRDPTVFLRTSRLLLFCQHCFTPLHLFFVQNPSTRHQILWS